MANASDNAQDNDEVKSLWAFNWIGGGYNQVHASTREEALQLGNEKGQGSGSRIMLRVNEASLYKVQDTAAFWRNYPIFD